MSISIELLQAAIKKVKSQYNGQIDEVALMRNIENIETVRKARADLDTQEAALAESIRIRRQEIAIQRERMQKLCQHLSSTYSRPTAECLPSNVCDVCGKELI